MIAEAKRASVWALWVVSGLAHTTQGKAVLYTRLFYARRGTRAGLSYLLQAELGKVSKNALGLPPLAYAPRALPGWVGGLGG